MSEQTVSDPRRLVLIVDDNADHLSFLRTAISTRFRVAVTSSGVDALKLGSQLHPDVILLDLTMPIVDGPAVIRQLRSDSSTNTIPIVLVTGVDADEVASLPERIHVAAVLRKPCHLGEILDAIKKAVSSPLSPAA